MIDRIKWELDPGSSKFPCPKCHKKRFVQYVHSGTTEYLPKEFGKCDRITECGHHHKPTKTDSLPMVKSEKLPEPKIVIPRDGYVNQILTDKSSNFHKFCHQNLGIDLPFFDKWGIGTGKNKTVFLLKNIKGECINLKSISFNIPENKDIKRDKTKFPFYLGKYYLKHEGIETDPDKLANSNRYYSFGRCFFGEHLLDPEKETCIVESEKTAFISAYFFPDFNWLAVGGSSGLKWEQYQILKNFNKKVWYLVDNDIAGTEKSTTKKWLDMLGSIYKDREFSTLNLFSASPKGWDLADAIILNNYRDPLCFAKDIKAFKKIENEYEIDLRTGEVKKENLKGSVALSTPKKEKEDEFPYANFHWPEGLKKQKDFNEIENKKHFANFRFIEFNNKTFIGNLKDSEVYFKEISNFTMKALYLIRSKTDPKRIFEIKNCFGLKRILDMPTKALVNFNQFSEIVESEGNFIFTGNKSHLNILKQKYFLENKEADEIKTLGWQDEGFYAFSNGVYSTKYFKADSYGVVEMQTKEGENKNFFIPAASDIYSHEKGMFDLDKLFVYTEENTISFDLWIDKFYKTYGEKGIISFCFYASCLFHDFIGDFNNFFPLLFHYGQSGTGKSSICTSMDYMFGKEKKPFNLHSGTDAGFHRVFCQFKNAVVWFDEYRNDIEPKRIQFLKGSYDLVGHTKSESNGNGTYSSKTANIPILSAANVSGQQMPIADLALMKRVILLEYHQTSFTDDEKNKFSELREIEKKGLSHLTAQIVSKREQIEKNYRETYIEVDRDFSDILLYDPNIETRIVKNMASIGATFKILEQHFNFPFAWEKVSQVMIKNIRFQNELTSNSNETNVFWDSFSYMINEQIIQSDSHYIIKYEQSITINSNSNSFEKKLSEITPVLYIGFNDIYQKMSETQQRGGKRILMDKGSLKNYLQNTKEYLGYKKSQRFGSNKNTSSLLFDCNILKKKGFVFDGFSDELDDSIKESNNHLINQNNDVF